MKLILIFAILAALPTTLGAQSALRSKSNPVEVELRRIEEQRSQAIKEKDMKILNRIYADDFRGVAASGRVVDKAQLLEVFRNSDPQLTFTVCDLEVRVFQNTAVVTGMLAVTSPDNKPAGSSRFIHVYIKRDRRWQFVAGQATTIG